MKLFVVFIVFGVSIADIHRSKRYLIFPPTSPTRMQLIAGIGIPVQLEYESVTFGYTFKAEYFLQDNVTIANHFFQDPFNPIPHPITNRRKRHALLVASNKATQKKDPIEVEQNETESYSTTNDHYEKYDVEAIEIDTGLTGIDSDEDDTIEFYGDEIEKHHQENNEEHEEGQDEEHDEEPDGEQKIANYLMTNTKDYGGARWTLFKGIEMLAQRKGLAGRPCMLRSICESSQAPFSIKSGILGELMHVIMTPSLTKDTINDHYQNEYLRAEELGRSGAPCDQVFKECTTSVLDQFSGIYKSVENLFKIFG